MNQILVLVVAAIVLIALYFFRRAPSPPLPPSPKEGNGEGAQTFVFNPDKPGDKLALPRVKRRTTIVAPPQSGHRVQIDAEPLPLNMPAPPQSKGIQQIVTLVIAPKVTDTVTRNTLYDFDPALDLTVEYTDDDAAAVPQNADGTPQLSIIISYETDGKWNWERLVPTIDTHRRTLNVKLTTLHPNDPVSAGSP